MNTSTIDFSPASDVDIKFIKNIIAQIVGPDEIAANQEAFDNLVIYNRPQPFSGPSCTISHRTHDGKYRISCNETEWQADDNVEMLAIVYFLSKISMGFSRY